MWFVLEVFDKERCGRYVEIGECAIAGISSKRVMNGHRTNGSDYTLVLRAREGLL
jgi:hypothetical protein